MVVEWRRWSEMNKGFWIKDFHCFAEGGELYVWFYRESHIASSFSCWMNNENLGKIVWHYWLFPSTFKDNDKRISSRFSKFLLCLENEQWLLPFSYSLFQIHFPTDSLSHSLSHLNIISSFILYSFLSFILSIFISNNYIFQWKVLYS